MSENNKTVKEDVFINLRHNLHRLPELSGREFKTQKTIAEFIRRYEPNEVFEVGTTGLVFRFDGEKNVAKSIMIRSELDALPIQELNDFTYKSTQKNISHKCGHDGHMSILARLAFLLQQNRSKYGRVYLLYQPAEENGKGASAVYADEKFKKLNIDAIIALHNIPGFPRGSIILKKGAFTPAVQTMITKFHGKTSHAAEPEKGLNPALAMSDFIKQVLAKAQPEEQRDDFFLITPVYLTMGGLSYGVSAGYGEVHLTIRCWDTGLLYKKSDELKHLATGICKKNDLKVSFEWAEAFEANQNDSKMVDFFEQAAATLSLKTVHLKAPMKWGEDFGLFTSHYCGAMFGLGVGENHPALHNPDYDFPDELIVTGSNQFFEIIKYYFNA